MKRTKQWLSLALALIMALSMLPMNVFAADDRYNNAQTISGPNGDGRTPYNPQWVDGASGIVSFNVQDPDLFDTTGMVDLTYAIYVYRDGTFVGSTYIPTKMSGTTAQVDVSEFMVNNGKYEFLVCFYDIQDSAIVAKSAPYQYGGGIELPPPPSTDFTYEDNNDGGITITGYAGDSVNLVIPGEIDGKTVTEIGMRAFYMDDYVSVTIPDSVTYIGQEAFMLCDDMTSLNLGNGLKAIGFSAFQSCYALNNVIIPDSVDEICSRAFKECTSLTSITIPATVVKTKNPSGTIDYTEQFDGCTALRTVHWKTAMDIPSGMFIDCDALTELYLYEGETFNEYAFEYTIADAGLNLVFEIPANLVVYAAYDTWTEARARDFGFTVQSFAGGEPAQPVTPAVPAQPAAQPEQPAAPVTPVQPGSPPSGQNAGNLRFDIVNGAPALLWDFVGNRDAVWCFLVSYSTDNGATWVDASDFSGMNAKYQVIPSIITKASTEPGHPAQIATSYKFRITTIARTGSGLENSQPVECPYPLTVTVNDPITVTANQSGGQIDLTGSFDRDRFYQFQYANKAGNWETWGAKPMQSGSTNWINATFDGDGGYLYAYEMYGLVVNPDGSASMTSTQRQSTVALINGGTALAQAPATSTTPTQPAAPPAEPVQPAAPPASGITVSPTASEVFINGGSRSFEAYNIEGSNYFKLRDLAYV
ncbi:MAG: leucine-rich repeat protein, partial [Clostridiales bacterium]|nr:leucine-rich repeat protein [Clostridiales bacterium]